MSLWQPYTACGVTLEPLCEARLELVREWRNDPKIAAQMLDKSHISAEQQQRWFAALKEDPCRVYFVALFKNEPIGVASLINIDRAGQSAEPGMYIYPDKYRNNIVPFCVAFALNDFAFDVLKLQTLFGKVYRSNHSSVRFHERSGYRQYGESAEDLLLISLTHQDYLKAREPIARFIRY